MSMDPVKIGKVEQYIHDTLKKDGAMHITLIDPAEQSVKDSAKIAKIARDAGTDAVMVGGTVGAALILDDAIQEIKKKVKLPVILFPGNIDGISRFADAIYFMTLMNSNNPYWITGAQALSAPTIYRYMKKFNLEPIPMAYLIVEPGEKTAAGWVGNANPLPRIKPKLTAAYVLAAQLLGLRMVYLEAGSGAPQSVPNDIIKTVKKISRIPVIVGGGIRTPEVAAEKVRDGADIIVTGTLAEENLEGLIGVVREIKRAGRARKAKC